MANTFRVESYRSAKSFSVVLIALFGVQLGCLAIYVILSVVQIAAPDIFVLDDGSGVTVPIALIGLASLVEIPARLATIVLFLVWLYRVYGNLSPLKALNLEFSPGWAVGWWFIPFANLIKPYQAVTEAWRESDPDYSEDFGYLTSSVENPWIFPVWWGFWILGNVFARITDNVAGGDTIPDSFAYLLLLSSIFTGVAAAAAIWIIRDTTRRQELRAERIGRTLNDLQPPPPPIFHQEI